MDEAVLVLCLHHVVPLRSHECDMPVNIDCLLMLDPFQHGIDHNEAACSTNPRTEKALKKRKRNKEPELLEISISIATFCPFASFLLNDSPQLPLGLFSVWLVFG